MTFSALQSEDASERGPIIAVMSQPLGNATAYLPASYVKWIELGALTLSLSLSLTVSLSLTLSLTLTLTLTLTRWRQGGPRHARGH